MSNFEGAGQESGLEIWRIEDFEAVPYDQSKYGKFHVGDSYIVLKVTMITISCTYSLWPKLLAESWFMKQRYKIQHGLEDPKQATIHLALALQLK